MTFGCEYFLRALSDRKTTAEPLFSPLPDATAEFEITEERIGVYLPVEHIDNPKGYGGNEDPRKVRRLGLLLHLSIFL